MNGFCAEFPEVTFLLEDFAHLDDTRFHKWIKPVRGLLADGSPIRKINAVKPCVSGPRNPFFNGFFVLVQPPGDFANRNPCAMKLNHFLTDAFVRSVRFFS